MRVARERFKFSCAHMTVFPGGSKERLHGHNFTIALEIELADISFQNMVDFAPIKRALGALCGEWKEHLLLPERSPHLQIERDDGDEIELRLCGKRYVLPREDVLFLPVDNVAVEPLAQLAARRLFERLAPVLRPAGVVAFEVTVEEAPGQGGTCRLTFSGEDKL
jgi:6-pyruvoyltetrahydropterin/6-carboxytetrahydropterin synthase